MQAFCRAFHERNPVRFRFLLTTFMAVVAAASGTCAWAQSVEPVLAEPAGLKPLAMQASGRLVAKPAGFVLRQWPGSYFETAIQGRELYFRVGAGDVNLAVSVDGGAPVALLQKPAAGLYKLSGLAPDKIHRARVAVVSENQGAPSSFGGFLIAETARPAPLERRARQIEFIGDSHTVGYGNRSSSKECTADQLWASTDTSQGVAGILAARFGADFQVNAISGRGVVRNYDGGAGDTLPQAYPFALYDHSEPVQTAGWLPQVIAISLGTNDFSTPLRDGEPWKTRGQLRDAYEKSYVAFVSQLLQRYPSSYIVLWIVGDEGTEARAEVARVFDQLQRSGQQRVGFVPVSGLSMNGCHYHPNVADDQKIADAIARHLEAQKTPFPAPAGR
jgi:lysophospholipase L1-like esterase